jgi:tetratricopeptide (TPR) repeat protein
VTVIEIVDSELSSAEGDLQDFGETARAPIDDDHAHARELAKRGNYAEALAEYQKLYQRAETDPLFVAEYAHWLARAGKLEQAKELLLAAKAVAPSDHRIALELGSVLERKGEDSLAVSEFERALELQPNHSRTRVALGDLLRTEGRIDEAIAALEPAAKSGSNEDRARALTVLGRCLMLKGDTGRARALLKEAVERAPASVNTWVAAAYAFLDSKDQTDVARALEHGIRVSKLAPEAALGQRLLGRIHERRGARADAIAAYRQALVLEPSSAAARERLLRLSLEDEDFKTAHQQSEALLSLAPTDPQNQFMAGLVEARMGHPDPAREHYRRAAELKNGHYPEAWFNLGKVESDADNAALAIEAYQRAIEEKPDYAAAWNNLGRSELDHGDSEAAQTAFEKAIALAPEYALAWHNLGRLHYREQRFSEAAAAYEKAAALEPGDRSLELKLAIALRKAGNEGRAVETYRHMLAQHPRYVTAWFNLGVALAAAGKDAEARAAYEKALELEPDHAASLKNLGYLEARAGNTERAQAFLDDALDHEPGDAETRLKLAELYLLGSDAPRCRAEVERVLAQNAENPSARAMLARCTQ